MGTMQEELKKVIDNWDKPTTTQSTTQEKTMEIKTQSQRIVEFIGANPGMDSIRLLTALPKAHSDIKEGNISSFLKQLCDGYKLKRIDTGKVSKGGRPLYQYYVMTDAERAEAQEQDRIAEQKHQEAVARAAKAREAKAKKAKERAAKQTAQPTPQHTAPTPQTDTGWTVGKALANLSVLQARQVYDELKKIFGA